MSFSLNHRLILFTSFVLCIFLGVTGVVLNKAFSISLNNIVREKLKLHTYNLLSLADNKNGTIYLPANYSQQLLNNIDDSLLAIVTDSQHKESWRSVSASNKRFSLPAPSTGEWLFGQAQDNSGNTYYVSSYSTTWPDEHGKKHTFIFTVMENLQVYQKEINDYRNTITLALIGIALVLLALQLIILHWGLKPVRGLASDVEAMNKGKSASLTGHYPKELRTLSANLNLLIENERRQRERYRNRMADLSHSLKTPLSVLRGIASDTNTLGHAISREKILISIQKQVSKMDTIVDHQLQRAVSSKQQSSFIACSVLNETQSIIGALNKVYIQKNITPTINIDKKELFYGDENDLAEILGNLLDNAYKYCQNQVTINANSQQKTLTLSIEDDGLGIPPEERFAIIKRGVRLDSRANGQGFGLAIVNDIITSYKGTLIVGESLLGGAQFLLKIPVKQ